VKAAVAMIPAVEMACPAWKESANAILMTIAMRMIARNATKLVVSANRSVAQTKIAVVELAVRKIAAMRNVAMQERSVAAAFAVKWEMNVIRVL